MFIELRRLNRVFPLTWAQFPEDWLGSPTWPPFYCLRTPTGPPQSSQVLKFRKREMLAGDCAKGGSVLCFLCRKRQTILGGSGGMLPRKCYEICTSQIAGNAPSSPPFCFVSCCLLREPMLLWSAWANMSAYNSSINGWKSWRNKKIGRTRTDWTLAEVQCQWRSEFGIHEHFWKLKRLSYLREKWQCVRNACVGVRAWDCIEMRETHAQCVRLESSAAVTLRETLYKKKHRTHQRCGQKATMLDYIRLH